MSKVNLDALVPREDFEFEENANPGKKKETLSIEDLKNDSFFFSSVRKPDFQRETNEWEPEKIVAFLESFIGGDLIPAIILWRNTSGFLFVIDGSHRLSSLSAWINNDFGDGDVSKKFYDGIIPDEQNKIAESTRKMVKKRIGLYSDYKLALTSPEKVEPNIAKNAKNLGALAVQLQWVEGDASKAENSFFKINQQAAPIDNTELILLESRKKPNCIAARAIIRGGKGHKYWDKFVKINQERIQELAKEINNILFSPKLETPIKTLDIPIGGKSYSAQALPLILDFVNISNTIPSNFKDVLSDDSSGDETIKYLTQSLKVARRINSNHPSSLGLHPVAYFYSQDGRYKTASFLAIASFVQELEKRKLFEDFILTRSKFEGALIKYDYLIQQINRRYRSAMNSYEAIRDFYFEIIKLLKSEKSKDFDEIVKEIVATDKYNYLALQIVEFKTEKKDFTTEKKSAVYIKDALSNAPLCKICNAMIHRNSTTIDHIQRKADGGVGAIENGQLAHPYCNTTYKN